MPNAYADGPPAPTLGYGQPTEATIDQVNIWMRSTPWYQAQMRAWGQDPGHPTLTKSQSQQILKMAQANGVVVDEGNMELDDHGNLNPKGHKLRNTLIVIGVAAATIATMGAAGVFAGAAAGGAAGAGGAALPVATGVGGLSATSLGLGTTAGLGTAGAVGATAAGVGAAGAGVAGSGVAPLVAGSAGATAASKIPSWLAPVLGTVVPVAGSLIGTKMATDANTDAARIQAESAQQALDFEKQQYADLTGRLAPYIASGTTSNDRMAQLLGLPARTGTTATASPTRGPAVGNYQPPAAAPTAPQTAPAPSGVTPGTVLMQAPDGSTKAVPADQVAHYQALGAKVAA